MNSMLTTDDLLVDIEQARIARAQFLAKLFSKVGSYLGDVFISELRATRETALTRLQSASS